MAYSITVAELTDQFNQLKQLAKAQRGMDSEILSSNSVTDVESSKQQAVTTDVTSREGANQPITEKKRQTSSQPMTDSTTGALNEPITSEGIVAMETSSEPITGFVVSKDDEDQPITGDVISSNIANEPITNDIFAMDTANQPITESKDQTVKADQLQSVIMFDLCSLSEIATEKSAIIGVSILYLFFYSMVLPSFFLIPSVQGAANLQIKFQFSEFSFV